MQKLAEENLTLRYIAVEGDEANRPSTPPGFSDESGREETDGSKIVRRSKPVETRLVLLETHLFRPKFGCSSLDITRT